MRRTSYQAAFLAGALIAMPASAGSIEKLHAFIEQTRSAKANFTQEVIDTNGTVQQQASGTVQFQRPGKFRWTYDKPYEQIIVGDGEKLWIYDKDLNQVTQRNLDKALGSSPAALLAGADDVDKYFSLSALGVKRKLDWLEVKPYDEGSLFDRVRMGFRGNTLEVMELHDHLSRYPIFNAIPRPRPTFTRLPFPKAPTSLLNRAKKLHRRGAEARRKRKGKQNN